MAKKRKIGLYGGTFNPVHIGHLLIADEVYSKLGMDEIILIPAYKPPHKEINSAATTEDRIKMLRLAIKEKKYFSICDYEIKMKGISYTINTIGYIKDRYENAELFFILGNELLKDFTKWKDYKEILRIVKLIVVKRELCRKKYLEKYQKRLIYFDNPYIEINSTEIRKRIKASRPFTFMLPGSVCNYIVKKGIYS